VRGGFELEPIKLARDHVGRMTGPYNNRHFNRVDRCASSVGGREGLLVVIYEQDIRRRLMSRSLQNISSSSHLLLRTD